MGNHEFASIKIGLASPDMIRSWSYGEVTKPETINYRTLKPEVGGLFCERIFGPMKDGACACGKYKNSHSKEVIKCEKCGVDVTTKKVRRERMGHIELATPVSHIWYFKAIPSRMALVLDMSPKQLEQVLYFAENVVLDPGTTPLEKGMVLSEKQYTEAREMYGNSFRAGMGAEAIEELLKEVGLTDAEAARRFELEKLKKEKEAAGETLSTEEKEELENLCRVGVSRTVTELKQGLLAASGQKKIRYIKRLEVFEAFRKSGNHLDWMIIENVPVIPPDIRPMVQLDGGRFASSDLNELYRRVISRNNRLRKLLEIRTPEIVIRNEKRMLQEAVDSLIDNGRRGKPVTGPSNRPLKSLSEMLRGKQGRFRQNLLGKRVDYSGRSVIVVGPSLKIYQCGLPKEMALELFKPFVVKRLVEMQKATNVKDAQKKIEKAYENPAVWDALENVIKEHPVLLNRAPTLHRLSIQAFEPVLVEGRAIKLHPLVCTAFNADFDGDQMPVHVPLSSEAQAEARFLMLSANNLLKPVDGNAVTVPTQDMILGSYYLTIVKPEEPGTGRVFRDFDEAVMAYEEHQIGLHAPIAVRYTKKIGGVERTELIGVEVGENGEKRVVTGPKAVTLGRLIYNKPLPQDLGFVDRTKPGNEFALEVAFVVTKKELSQIVDKCAKHYDTAQTAEILDAIKEMGYKYSTKAAISISVYDMTIPDEKKDIIAESEKKVGKVIRHFNRGELSETERYNSVIKIWEQTTKDVTAALLNRFDRYNPIKIMSDSGARGSVKQMYQLAGMRGLMFATNGKTLEIPIKSNFREGLNILEYFMGAKGSRKSLSDTALRTADSGYLTRRLVDVSQDVIVREEKCDTKKGAWINAIFDRTETSTFDLSSPEKLAGNYSAFDVKDPKTGEIIVGALTLITSGMEKQLRASGLKEIELAPKALESLEDRIRGRYTMGPIVNPKTGEVIAEDDTRINEDIIAKVVEAGIGKVYIRSVIQCHAKHGICAHCYGDDLAFARPVSIGEAVGIIAAQSIGEPGTQLTMRTFHSGGVAGSDITQGLPRVEELFEARSPKKAAIMSEVSGTAYIAPTEFGAYEITINTDDGEIKKYQIPYGTRLAVTDGDRVEKGQALTEGNKSPADIMRILGLDAVYEYLIKEVQKVYRSQDVRVNDKHIEIICRQMTRKVKVDFPGSTELLEGATVDLNEFEEQNEAVEARLAAGETTDETGAELSVAEGSPVLLGITKAALQTESFLSAASFQETTKVLTEAAIKGKVDNLLGLKENVIIGKLIPAGTGMDRYKNITVVDTEGVGGASDSGAIAG